MTPITAIAVLVNETAIDDLKVFLHTLQLWNPVLPTLYIFCTTDGQSQIEALEYKGEREYAAGLDVYSNLSRKQMEQMPSRQGFSNLFHDFTIEKCTL